MAQTVDGIASLVEQLNERVRELERRVSVLESPPTRAERALPAAIRVTAVERERPPATWRGFPPPQSSAGAVPVLGKAILGIAGAYLLRAIAESGAVPKLPVLVIAIVYAGLWLVWAVRLHAGNGFASLTYGVTSALILSPLLWESTVRFHVLSPVFTGGVLVAFVVLMLKLTWRLNLQMIPWIVALSAVNTALALIVATHALVPLTAGLLAMALVVEVAVCLGHPLSLRALPAVACNLAILLLVDVMTSADGVPEGYQAASPATLTALCLALLAIYGGSIAVRGFWLLQPITVVDMAEAVLAFALAAFGTMRASHGSAAPFLGALYLLFAIVCYWGVLRRFAPEPYTRNRRVSATWAAALLVTGSLLLFPAGLAVLFQCAAAIGATFLYTRTGKISLGVHGSIFLAAATAVSPLPNYAENALAGTVPGGSPGNAWIVAVSAALCYAMGWRDPQAQGRRRGLWLVPALLVSFAAAAFAVSSVAWFAGGLELAPSRLSVIRTVVNCALALGLAFLGSRWKRVELGWIAYAAVAFGTLKLLFEDLRFGNAASLVFSLLFYGMILILLPRLMPRSRSQAE